jgi:uncharacterized protein YdcH (DUF465 family)
MSDTPHDLSVECPKDAAKFHRLNLEDAHFAGRVTKYHEVNRFVHRAETRVDVMDAAAESALRHKRMILKDRIVRLRAAA